MLVTGKTAIKSLEIALNVPYTLQLGEPSVLSLENGNHVAC